MADDLFRAEAQSSVSPTSVHGWFDGLAEPEAAPKHEVTKVVVLPINCDAAQHIAQNRPRERTHVPVGT